MQPELIIPFLEHRIKEQGHSKYVLEYEQLTVKGNSSFTIQAHNAIYMLVDTPKYIRISSDYGQYNHGSKNVHEHRGSITLENTDTSETWVSFVKMIIQA
jgi:hypothetical protein